jgi:hypothetical protein
MNGTWLQKWSALREKRSGYPRVRQALLWTRDSGLVLVVALCMGLALFASPTVLSDHPWLQSYVDFMGGYFGAVQRLSVGALYPQVSQLVFAVGWSVAIVPFVAWLTHTLIYILVLDYQKTKADMKSKYEIKTKTGGQYLEKFGTPIFTLILVLFYLGDFGVINNFGWVNGLLMTHAEIAAQPHNHINKFILPIYTSRWGLGIVSPLLIYVGVALYSAVWVIPFFYLPIWLRRRFARQKHDDAVK